MKPDKTEPARIETLEMKVDGVSVSFKAYSDGHVTLTIGGNTILSGRQHVGLLTSLLTAGLESTKGRRR